MTYSLTIFILACLGMSLMIVVKFFELKAGKDFIFVRWRKQIDEYAHFVFMRMKKFVVTKEKKSIAFVRNIPVHVLELVSKLHLYLYKKYGKHVDMIKGKKIPTNKGSVSFFVSSISDYKKEIKR